MRFFNMVHWVIGIKIYPLEFLRNQFMYVLLRFKISSTILNYCLVLSVSIWLMYLFEKADGFGEKVLIDII